MVARCFELELSRFGAPESYFKSISAELKPKRDRLAKLLLDIGLTPVIPEGGYFMLADISKIAKEFETDANEMKDSKFVKYLIKQKVFYWRWFLQLQWFLYIIMCLGFGYDSEHCFL